MDSRAKTQKEKHRFMKASFCPATRTTLVRQPQKNVLASCGTGDNSDRRMIDHEELLAVISERNVSILSSGRATLCFLIAPRPKCLFLLFFSLLSFGVIKTQCALTPQFRRRGIIILCFISRALLYRRIIVELTLSIIILIIIN